MIEWAVTSSVLILVVLILRRCLKGRVSLRLQYGLWALVLVRLLMPISVGSTAWSVLNVFGGSAQPDQILSSAVVTYVGGGVPDLSIEEPDPAPPLEEQRDQYEQNRQQWQAEVDADRVQTGTPISAAQVLLAVWGAGAAGVGLWFVWVNLRFARRLRRSRIPMGVENYPLPVYRTQTIQTPCLFGLVRPAVYVTPAAAADPTVLRHSLAHEHTHFRHGDHVWALLRGVCLALHWYNPLVWLAAVLSRRDGELCCDESTVRVLGEKERASYGRTLLAVTCQSRSDPLLTATSMTGSGQGIKERILLLAKRPRTAIYTIGLVAVIAVAAVGCTLTGARVDTQADTPWGWAQSVTTQRLEEENEGIEAELLCQILNDLEEGNFAQVSAITDGQVVWTLSYDAAQYPFTLTQEQGVVYLEFEGAFWRVDYPELYDYVKTCAGGEITLAAGIDVPQAVADYAREYVSSQMTYYTEELGYELPGGEVAGLTQISTGTAGLDSGQSMYLLEYRLRVVHPEAVVLTEGMRVENGAITEWGSNGQPCLLLHWEDVGEQTLWEPVCVTYTDIIEQEYGTPEMLEKYSNAYTAAAMELYGQFLGNSSMDETFYQLLGDWYDQKYGAGNWYFSADQPGQPREGDIRLGPVRYQGGGIYLNETTGEVYVVEVSCCEDGQFRALPAHTLVLSRGQDGAFQRVLGALEYDVSQMTVEDIVLNVTYGLLDAEVSLRRDGYPLPIGPGAWADLFRPAYDGEPNIQIQEGYEPIYGEGDYWDRWSVEGFSALRYYAAAEDGYTANTIDVTRTDLYTPRGVRVGDSREQVLEAYPETLTGDYWGKYPEEPDLLAYVAWNPHTPGEISDLSQLEFYEGLGPAILFFFEGNTLRQITLTNMFN